MDCQPAESARIPVNIPLAFLAAIQPAWIMITLAAMSMGALEKITSCELMTMGAKISRSRMETTVPNTPKHCTTNASIHCFCLVPPSRGVRAMKGGATRYSMIMLKILATQSVRI